MFDITKIYSPADIVYGISDGYDDLDEILKLVKNIHLMKNEPEWLKAVADAIISVDEEEEDFWNAIREIFYKSGNDPECPDQILEWMLDLTKEISEFDSLIGYGIENWLLGDAFTTCNTKILKKHYEAIKAYGEEYWWEGFYLSETALSNAKIPAKYIDAVIKHLGTADSEDFLEVCKTLLANPKTSSKQIHRIAEAFEWIAEWFIQTFAQNSKCTEETLKLLREKIRD